MSVYYKYKPVVFYRIIKVRKSLGKPVIESMKWENMSFIMVCKWEWYFRYRSALLQIKYPKYDVQLIKGSVEPVGKTKLELEEQLKKKRKITCKRMVTKFTNIINEYEKEQKQLLFPNYSNKNYLKIKRKKAEYLRELQQLSN